MDNKRSLREIKREATVQSLTKAAFELAMERGLDGFVVEDVVQRAGYSRRTFANHFSCKEEAVASVVLAGMDQAPDLLAEIPGGMSMLDALHQLMRAQITAEMLWTLRELVSLSKLYPTLEPYILSVVKQLELAGQGTLSELAKGRYSDEYIQLLSGAVYGSFFPVIDGRLDVRIPGQSAADAPGVMTLDQFLDKVFGYLRNGF